MQSYPKILHLCGRRLVEQTLFVNHKSHQGWHGAENAKATATPTTAPER
jgi:hypothetical protein